jgi:hypothetical protein
VVLKKILLLWVKKIKKTMGLDLMVQEDGAPAYTSEYQQQVFNAFKVICILWPGNSPDLNTIKPCWF